MVELLNTPLLEKHLGIYDPECGTGGILSVGKEYLRDRAGTPAEKVCVEQFVTAHGGELSPTNYAICQPTCSSRTTNRPPSSSAIPSSRTIRRARSPEPGDQLPESRHRFDFMLSNPPFRVIWGGKDGTRPRRGSWARSAIRPGCPA